MKTLYNIEAEQAILGTIILNNQYLHSVSDILAAEHFYEPAHQKIFAQILHNVDHVHIVANQVTLKQFFESDGSIKAIGGALYLSTLLGQASAIISIRDYAMVVNELWKKRELYLVAKEIEETIESETLDNLLNKLDGAVNKIDLSCENIHIFNGEETAADWAQSVENEKNLVAIPTNLPKLDEMLNGGIRKENLYVFAAASGCGKTFFAQNIIVNALKSDLGVFFVSMEMAKKRIFARFISILGHINSFRVSIGKIFNWEEEKFQSSLEEWKKYTKKFFISEKISLSGKEIEASLKRVLRKSPIDLVVVDYAQIMKLRESRSLSEAALIKENVVVLAKLAQKYKVSVLLLSQLKKDSVSGKIGLGSLKGSGGLYEDAHCVVAMWAEEEQKEKVKQLQIEVIKNRDGSSSGLSINFDGDFGKFTEINF